MAKKDIHTQEVAALQKSVVDARAKLASFHFGGGRTKNVREGRVLRRTIAQALTEIRERDLKAQRESHVTIAQAPEKA